MNAQPSQYLDAAKYGEMAEKHNLLNLDVDKISGMTPEEKEASHEFFAVLQIFLKWLRGHRFAIIMALVGGYCFLSILEKLGVNTSGIGPTVIQFFRSIFFGF